MVVGVDAGAVAVGPEDPDGVAADGGDAVGPDRGRDGGGVEERKTPVGTGEADSPEAAAG